jgi:alpha-tubulin suppressor-like RCC1 family protein
LKFVVVTDIQSGKVYEYLVNEEISDKLEDTIDSKEQENSEKYIDFDLKIYSFENEKIVMISCGYYHSLALTESGRVFGWGYNIGRTIRRCYSNFK